MRSNSLYVYCYVYRAKVDSRLHGWIDGSPVSPELEQMEAKVTHFEIAEMVNGQRLFPVFVSYYSDELAIEGKDAFIAVLREPDAVAQTDVTTGATATTVASTAQKEIKEPIRFGGTYSCSLSAKQITKLAGQSVIKSISRRGLFRMFD